MFKDSNYIPYIDKAGYFANQKICSNKTPLCQAYGRSQGYSKEQNKISALAELMDCDNTERKLDNYSAMRCWHVVDIS